MIAANGAQVQKARQGFEVMATHHRLQMQGTPTDPMALDTPDAVVNPLAVDCPRVNGNPVVTASGAFAALGAAPVAAAATTPAAAHLAAPLPAPANAGRPNMPVNYVAPRLAGSETPELLHVIHENRMVAV